MTNQETRILPTEDPPDLKAAYDKLVEIDQIIDMESLNRNSVVVIRLHGDEGHRIRMHQAFTRFFETKKTVFNEKKLTVLFLTEGDSIETIPEKEMNAVGWYRRDKSLIVNPFQNNS